MNRRFNQRGMSLVEFMVSITIGLLIMAAVITAFSAVIQTRTRKAELERSLEAYRFVTYTLMDKIRTACAVGSTSTATSIVLRRPRTVAYVYDPSNPSTVFLNSGSTIPLASAGRGSLDSGQSIKFEGVLNNLTVNTGDADVSDGGTFTLSLLPGITVAVPNFHFSRITTTDQETITLDSASQSVTISVNGGTPQAVASGLSGLTFSYGRLADVMSDRVADGTPSDYQAPSTWTNTEWDNVRSIKISLTLATDGTSPGIQETFVATLRSKMMNANESLRNTTSQLCHNP